MDAIADAEQLYSDENNAQIQQSAAATATGNGPESGGLSYSIHKPIIPTGKIPSGRGGASAVHADGKVVLFGGHYFEGNEKFAYLDETWLLDVERLAWYKMTCSGQVPGPRYGHSAHIFGSRMFIFGGKGPGGVIYNDVYFLDLVEWIWVPVVSISPGPTPRFFHAAEQVGKKLVIHGGWNGSDVFSDLWIFNTDSFAWMQPRTAGFAPTPRYGHTFTLAPTGCLIIFGGCTLNEGKGVPKYLDDVRQLDTETMIWVRPRVDGPTPTGRYGHTSILLDDGLIAVFGGWGKGGCQSREYVNDPRAYSLHILDSKTMHWWVPRRLGKKQSKHLYNHGAVRLGGSSVLMVSGFDGRQAINDIYVANIEV